jgi:uncharacterized protein
VPQTLDEFRGLFSESSDPRQWPHIATGITYQHAMRELAMLLGCEPTEDGVYAHRLATAPDVYAATLLRATWTEWLLVDDGFPPPGEGAGWQRMGELAEARSAPIMRIERVAEEGIDRGLGLDALREHVRAEVGAARDSGFVGLKTIAAYRSGLAVRPHDPANEEGAEAVLREAAWRTEPKPLLDLLLCDALEANAADPLPLQVHCGFGDADLFLPGADPSLLKPLVERFDQTPFVLLHCYPFIRQAGWMAHVYANVFLDVSLTVPHVWRVGEMIRQALELAPVSKLLYASDAARTPELYYLAATWAREALAEVLAAALPPEQAETAGRRVLRETALALYGLEA